MGFAIAGATVVGAAIASNSASSAADKQQEAAAAASAVSERQYQQARTDAEPWRQTGVAALDRINQNMGDFTKDFTAADFQADPGYAFRLAEGQKALERSAGARGGSSGGATVKALTKYGQGVASEEYGNAYNRFNADRDRRFNRLAALSGIGQTANAQVTQSGTNYANQVSENTIGAGNAGAAASIATGNAVNGAIGQGANTWMQYQMMNRLAPEKG